MFIWCLFDRWFALFWLSNEQKCKTKMSNANYSPVFAFTRLCCLTIPVVRPARQARVTSDLLDSSLHWQSVSHALWCRRQASYKYKDANSTLQFLHFETQESLFLLALLLTYLSAYRQPPQFTAADWASWLPLAAFTVAWTSFRLENARLWPT
jgi:hypothetical protein